MRASRVALLLITLFAFGVAVAYAPTINNPDLALACSNATGVVYLKGSATFTSMSLTGTGGIVDFSGFRWDPTGVTPGRIGFITDGLGDMMNVTSLNTMELIYRYEGGVGQTQRIWSPDWGEPVSITGGVMAYDSTWAVTTVTVNDPDGEGTVVIRWSGGGVPDEVDFSLYYTAFTLLSAAIVILAAVAVIMALTGGGDVLGVALAVSVFAVIGVIGVWILTVLINAFA